MQRYLVLFILILAHFHIHYKKHGLFGCVGFELLFFHTPHYFKKLGAVPITFGTAPVFHATTSPVRISENSSLSFPASTRIVSPTLNLPDSIAKAKGS